LSPERKIETEHESHTIGDGAVISTLSRAMATEARVIRIPCDSVVPVIAIHSAVGFERLLQA
jgi:hypothetical protein